MSRDLIRDSFYAFIKLSNFELAKFYSLLSKYLLSTKNFYFLYFYIKIYKFINLIFIFFSEDISNFQRSPLIAEGMLN